MLQAYITKLAKRLKMIDYFLGVGCDVYHLNLFFSYRDIDYYHHAVDHVEYSYASIAL